ncbi:MAG: undecaprenyl-phosphate glucose phosphotransferase [Microscillaceae bacterium]|nr:undecaprenyl-phosphate glucose phosphotransferase [Microscillaceae bacterium]
MSNDYSKFIRLINLVGDILILNASFLIAFVFKLWSEFGFNIPNAYLSLLLYINLVWLLISFILENYELNRLERISDVLLRIIQSVFIHLFFVIFLIFFIKTDYFSRVQLLLNYTFFTVFIILWRIIMIQFLRVYRSMGYNCRDFVIVGYGKLGNALLHYFALNPQYGYRFKGFFDDQIHGKDIIGKLADLRDFVENNQIDEVYVALPDIDDKKIKEITQLGDDNLLRVKVIPDIQVLTQKTIKIENYGSILVIHNRKEPLEDVFNRVIKRIFDIVFSFFVLVLILSWFIPLVGLFIKLDSKGPIFFMQKRGGKDGQKFWCIKFRTMYCNQGNKFKLVTRNDKRITRVGSFLRKTSLDELPQFINVLLGDMTIVGPRPHAIEIDTTFKKIVDKYMVRYLVKPGITGLAQIKGFRGSDDDVMRFRVKLDIFYVENWSFYLDIKIILLTVIKMLRGDKNAF